MGIVPSLDEIEYGQPRFGLGLEAKSVNEFAFEGGKETFTQGIIKAITERAHRGADTDLAASLAEGDGVETCRGEVQPTAYALAVSVAR